MVNGPQKSRWAFCYKVRNDEGRRIDRHVDLGSAYALDLAGARERASNLKAAIRAGRDPLVDERLATVRAVSLGAALARWEPKSGKPRHKREARMHVRLALDEMGVAGIAPERAYDGGPAPAHRHAPRSAWNGASEGQRLRAYLADLKRKDVVSVNVANSLSAAMPPRSRLRARGTPMRWTSRRYGTPLIG